MSDFYTPSPGETRLLRPRNELERDVREFVSIGSGVGKIYPGNINKSRPTKNDLFGTVLLIVDRRYGVPEELERTRDDGFTWIIVRSRRVAKYSVQWFRDGASEAAQRFDEWVDSSRGILESEKRDFQIESNLGFDNHGLLTQLDEIESDEFEERMGLNLSIAYLQESTYNAGRIQNIPLFTFNLDGREINIETE